MPEPGPQIPVSDVIVCTEEMAQSIRGFLLASTFGSEAAIAHARERLRVALEAYDETMRGERS